MDQNQKNQEPESMIAVLSFKGLDFGLAVSLLYSAGFLADEFFNTLSFDKLKEIFQTKNIDSCFKDFVLNKMEERAADFWQLKTIFDFTPRDEYSSSACKKRDKVINTLKDLAGNDFDKLYALFKPLNKCYEMRGNIVQVRKELEDKIWRDRKFTFEQCRALLTGEPTGTLLYNKAYYRMMVIMNDEFRQTAK